MSKQIVSVGVSIASDHVQHFEILSKKSLLDWDIIIFRPDISDFLSESQYMGKRSFGDHKSTYIKEAANHWAEQINIALSTGKTVFVFLCPVEDVYVATGEKRHSGTGRNRQTTTMVELFCNYLIAAVPQKWTVAEGSAMALDPTFRDALGSYWDVFSDQSTYHVTWDATKENRCAGTKTGNRTTALCIKSNSSDGAVFFLPDLPFDSEDYYTWSSEKEDYIWTAEGKRFGDILISELVKISKTMSAALSRSAAPSWVADERFTLPGENEIRSQISALQNDIEQLKKIQDKKTLELDEVEKMKGLLFETGKPLEDAILRALQALGFTAENYTDGKSEFDAVFTCNEGRFVGEAEGKDSKQINITKLRQLNANILEDLERDEVTSPAKGVLFGNAHRFTSPDEREPCFTDKCIATALTASIALVDTPSLFRVAAYCLANKGTDVAERFRQRLITEKGPISVDDLIPKENETPSPGYTPILASS